MRRSTDRILTTHTGSLPRDPIVLPMLHLREANQPYDVAAFEREVDRAVRETVQRQIDAGVDIVNDGEQSKVLYLSYMRARLSGIVEVEPHRSYSAETADPLNIEFFTSPASAIVLAASDASGAMSKPVGCVAPLAWRDFAAVEADIARLRNAVADKRVADVFMSAASPGIFSETVKNRYYPSEEAYLYAIAGVMKREYKAITDAGFVLQLDCPDLACMFRRFDVRETVEEFRRKIALRVEVINHAIDGLPLDQVRMHVCWGAIEEPHHQDIPLDAIIDILLRAKPQAMTIVAANGRHEHEWAVWRDVKLPDGNIIIPGVIDNSTNIVEHPKTVAERIVRFANVLGRENVIAGVDCGLGWTQLTPGVAWAKARSLGQGAALASEMLWRG